MTTLARLDLALRRCDDGFDMAPRGAAEGDAVALAAEVRRLRALLVPPRNHGKRCCSFCGKEQNSARLLIAGPNVCICDECVSVSASIIFQEFAKAPCRTLEPAAPVAGPQHEGDTKANESTP